jgi:tRNA(Ile)-lysidine synthase
MELKILEEIHKHQMIQAGDRLLVAVSGGPDSMALLHWLWQQRRKLHITVRAIHLNHQFRGSEADEDQNYVEETCLAWGIPCSSTAIDVSHYAKEHKLSKQVAARECRYKYFEQVAQELGYNKLCLAHHSDDQLETVVMRFIRGAGLGGLSGIPAVRQTESVQIIRPFMTVRKDHIEAYCQAQQIHPRLDQSNLRDDYTRNKIRHHIVPQLLELNPQLHQVIHEMTDTLSTEDRFLDELAKNYIDSVIESNELHKLTINLRFFQEVPLALQRRLILLLLSYLPAKRSDWNKIHIEQMLSLMNNNKGTKQLHLPNGVRVTREYDYLYLSLDNEESNRSDECMAYLEYLPEEGEFILLPASYRISIMTHALPEAWGAGEHENKSLPTYRASFDVDQLSFPLAVRNRRAGDQIQPLGMDGNKKVKDIFIDKKVPLSERSEWPLIVDQEAIIWIPGLKRANRGKVTEKTKRRLTVIVEKMREDI